MDTSIALILIQDGITNGAIYALLAIALVLVFDHALMWQKLSFDALRVFAKDDLLELRTM